MMTVAVVEVDVQIVAQGMRASQLIGAQVDNDRNENIGTIDDLMITGDVVEFVILSVGGFLGLGARLVAVRFDNLVIYEDDQRIVLPGASRDELKRLAEFKYR